MSSAPAIPDRVMFAETGKVKIELEEWRPRDYLLTPPQTLELLRLSGKIIEVQSLPTGETRLRAKAVVGRLSTESLDLIIRPKCPVPSLLLMLAEMHELSRLAPQLVGYATSSEIVDLLVQVFLKQIDYITRVGLKRDYVPRQEDLLAVRGRVNVRRTLALHLRGRPRLDCSFEEYTLDVPENRLLLTALRAISKNKALPSIRRSLAHSVCGEFPGVREVEFGRQGATPIASDRLNQHYEPALKMAHLILRSMGIEHEFGSARVSGFTLDMNQLFERFIARRLQKALRREDVVVKFQQPHDFDEQKQATIRPDLIFQSRRVSVHAPGSGSFFGGNSQPLAETWTPKNVPDPRRSQAKQPSSWERSGRRGHRVVADTKYKVDEAPSPADLYQMLAYCRVLKIPCGILITAAGTGGRCYSVKDGATTIQVVPINLDGSLAEIDMSMKRLASLILRLLC